MNHIQKTCIGVMLSLCASFTVRGGEFEKRETVHYGPAEFQEGDLYLPTGDGTGLRPVVVIIHGGGWGSGSNGGSFAVVSALLASNGIAAYDINYNLAGKAYSAVPDAFAAVRFLRKNAQQYRLDPNAIGAAGWSAGGWSACYLGWTLPGDTVHVHDVRDANGNWIDSLFAVEPHDGLNRGYSSQVQALFLSSGLWFNNVKSEVWNHRPGKKPNPPSQLPPVFAIGGDNNIESSWTAFVAEYKTLGGAETKSNMIPQMKHAPKLADSEGGVSWDVSAEFVKWFREKLPVGTTKANERLTVRGNAPAALTPRLHIAMPRNSGTVSDVVVHFRHTRIDLRGRFLK